MDDIKTEEVHCLESMGQTLLPILMPIIYHQHSILVSMPVLILPDIPPLWLYKIKGYHLQKISEKSLVPFSTNEKWVGRQDFLA